MRYRLKGPSQSLEWLIDRPIKSCTPVTATQIFNTDQKWPKQTAVLSPESLNQQFLERLLKKTDLHPRKCRNVDCIYFLHRNYKACHLSVFPAAINCTFSYPCSVLGRKYHDSTLPSFPCSINKNRFTVP